ncbi:hypothetical protein [Streptomyces vinaceus]|uniref:hypothetical protein n=1 Tax=Streptomyces vinaceus TaxID=1960 RepID=UPI003697E587
MSEKRFSYATGAVLGRVRPACLPPYAMPLSSTGPRYGLYSATVSPPAADPYDLVIRASASSALSPNCCPQSSGTR